MNPLNASTTAVAQTDGMFRNVMSAVSVGLNAVVPGAGAVISAVTGAASVASMKTEGEMYLRLQMEMNRENRQFETMSNIAKSRHDAAMAAIRNIRG